MKSGASIGRVTLHFIRWVSSVWMVVIFCTPMAAMFFFWPPVSGAAEVKPNKPKAIQPQKGKVLPPDKKKIPVRPFSFECYASVSNGTTPYSRSTSVKVEGQVEPEGMRISFALQERIGGKAISRFNWAGIVKGKPHETLVRIAGETKFKEQTLGNARLVAGGGYSIFEVKLLYPGGKALVGAPTNAKAWRELMATIKETALARKSGELTGFRCYVPPSGTGPTESARSNSMEMECSIGSNSTIISFRSQEKQSGRTVSDFRWSGEIDGELHRKLVQVAGATKLKDSEKKSPSKDGVPVSGNLSNEAEITLRYPDGERTGMPSNLEEWKNLIDSIGIIARQSKGKPSTNPERK